LFYDQGKQPSKATIMATKPKPLESLRCEQTIEKLSLSVEASQYFMEALRDTSEPNDAMKKAAKFYREVMPD